MWDVIIVGGGAAGLSAALVLGRARRRTLVLNGGPPRNAPAEAAHGFFTRDGTPPFELLEIGRTQLAPYTTVHLHDMQVIDAARSDDGFTVQYANGVTEHTRKLLLATGVVDEVPPIPGLRELWGRAVFHCPYCHGWEMRDQPLGVYADGAVAMHFAPLVRQWSRDLVLLTGGPSQLADGDRSTLAALDIAVDEDRIARLDSGDDGQVRLVFHTGRVLPRAGIFVRTHQQQRSHLAVQLGCTVVGDGPAPHLIHANPDRSTNVPGLYVAGDMARVEQQVVNAAADGAMAAAWINNELVREDVARAASTAPVGH